MSTGMWSRVRPSWGTGEILDHPEPESGWEFILMTEVRNSKIQDAMTRRQGELADGDGACLIAYRSEMVEDLFGQRVKKHFRLVTAFIGDNDYARAFTLAVAEHEWPEDWDGEWKGIDIVNRADDIYRAAARMEVPE